MTLKSSDSLTITQKEVRLGDPHVNSDDRNNLSILLNIYEPLVTYGENGEFHPCLAESWTLDQDACSWTFSLRSGIKFHDASPFSASDVIASMQRVLSPHMSGELGTQSLYRSYLGDATIEALDRKTVRIQTPEPMADLLGFDGQIPDRSGISSGWFTGKTGRQRSVSFCRHGKREDSPGGQRILLAGYSPSPEIGMAGRTKPRCTGTIPVGRQNRYCRRCEA